MRRRTFLALPAAAAYPASKDLYNRLLEAITRMEVIDTHEHIIPEAQRVGQPMDFFTLAGHYAVNDVISAGLPTADRDKLNKPDVPAREKWQSFEPYWRYAKSTGYGEALRIAMKEVYGIEEVNATNLDRLNDAIGSRNKPGLYRDILKKRCRIRFAVNDEYWEPKPVAVDAEFFVMARKFDGFVSPITPEGLKRLESMTDSSVTSLDGLKRAMEKHFELALKLKMVTIKSTIAYQRDLYFPLTSTADAAADFEKLARGEGVVTDEKSVLESRPFRTLANHLFHHLVQLADAHRVPMQIHTGLQAGNGNFVEHTRPSLLNNLFVRYPRVQFDLFHIAFPYHHETTVLAKTFPNVCVDYCWMHIVSPSGARAALHEMLDSVPANKIFGYGGDYRYPELSYAHLLMARRNIARVLAERVEDGASTENEAVEVARWMLLDNPARLFSPDARRV